MKEHIRKFLLTYFEADNLAGKIYATAKLPDICICSEISTKLGIITIEHPDALHLHGSDIVVPNVKQPDLDAAIASIDVAIVLSGQQMNAVRNERKPRLEEADILVMKAEDSGVQIAVTAARKYRMALRDITKQPDPLNIKWPTKPVCLKFSMTRLRKWLFRSGAG